VQELMHSTSIFQPGVADKSEGSTSTKHFCTTKSSKQTSAQVNFFLFVASKGTCGGPEALLSYYQPCWCRGRLTTRCVQSPLHRTEIGKALSIMTLTRAGMDTLTLTFPPFIPPTHFLSSIVEQHHRKINHHVYTVHLSSLLPPLPPRTTPARVLLFSALTVFPLSL